MTAPETGVEPLTPRKRRRWHIAVMSGHDTKGRWRISGQTNAIAVMGGCDLDLRYAEIEGPEVVITAFAFWGGIQVIVPEGFDVELTGFSFMGGRSLKTATCPSFRAPPASPCAASPSWAASTSAADPTAPTDPAAPVVRPFRPAQPGHPRSRRHRR